jgi:hypothetical protein
LGEKFTLNFNVIVDPNNLRGYGSGVGQVNIAYESWGEIVKRYGLAEIDGYVVPPNDVEFTSIQQLKYFNFRIFNDGELEAKLFSDFI